MLPSAGMLVAAARKPGAANSQLNAHLRRRCASSSAAASLASRALVSASAWRLRKGEAEANFPSISQLRCHGRAVCMAGFVWPNACRSSRLPVQSQHPAHRSCCPARRSASICLTAASCSVARIRASSAARLLRSTAVSRAFCCFCHAAFSCLGLDRGAVRRACLRRRGSGRARMWELSRHEAWAAAHLWNRLALKRPPELLQLLLQAP